jgi:urease accessory protein
MAPLRYSRQIFGAALTLLALACATSAHAHTGSALPGGFALGFSHPFEGIDHLLAMLCVGLWGAFLGRPLIYLLPITFPAMMVVGAACGMAALELPIPPIEQGVALSVWVLGACIALAWRAPVWIAVAIVAVFAVFHGYAHGMMLPSATAPVGYSAGFVLATGLLHLSGIALGTLTRWRAGLVFARGAGAVIAAAGVWLLVQALCL